MRTTIARSLLVLALVVDGCSSLACRRTERRSTGQKETRPIATTGTGAASTPSLDRLELPDSVPQRQGSLALPVSLPRRTGDLDAMVRTRHVRALVVYSRSGFFYDKGRPRGISYEAMEEFQRFLNKTLGSRTRKVSVVYIPVRPDQLEAALVEGVGDVIATGVVVTPQRAGKVAFTVPLVTDVKQVVVTGPTAAPIATLDDLGGKEICVNPRSNYYENLLRLSDALRKAGRPAILVRAADEYLTDEDLLEMVNAGLIPATVVHMQRAQFWSKVFRGLTVRPDLAVADNGALAWVVRKDSPRLKGILDEFVEKHRVGTSFGNTLLRRYLQNTKWVTDSVSSAEMKKFQAYVGLFKKYSRQYDFDYLMLAAQAYQESMLDQNRRSPRGAVGIMQVIPRYAAASPINITNVMTADGNIHAGAKMLHTIAQTYFDDPAIDTTDRTLMTFAAYNAGAPRIKRLRERARREGLDPNRWFGNVEFVVAKDIGQETVQYVSNIYKYYVAYKLTLQQVESREAAKRAQ